MPRHKYVINKKYKSSKAVEKSILIGEQRIKKRKRSGAN